MASSSQSQEDLVRGIAETQGIQEGLICILRCVEPYGSYEIHRNREKQEIELPGGWRQCWHYSHYDRHPKLGLLPVRLRTGFPFAVHVKVYRPKEGGPRGQKEWRYRRKGVADLHRRAQVSPAAHERYLASLAAVEETRALGALTEKLCRAVEWKGQRVRALHPLSGPDAEWLEAVNRGEFTIHGLRDRDPRARLYGSKPVGKEEAGRPSAATTRKPRWLRAHGLIQNVQKAHRYRLTQEGTQAMTV